VITQARPQDDCCEQGLALFIPCHSPGCPTRAFARVGVANKLCQGCCRFGYAVYFAVGVASGLSLSMMYVDRTFSGLSLLTLRMSCGTAFPT